MSLSVSKYFSALAPGLGAAATMMVGLQAVRRVLPVHQQGNHIVIERLGEPPDGVSGGCLHQGLVSGHLAIRDSLSGIGGLGGGQVVTS